MAVRHCWVDGTVVVMMTVERDIYFMRMRRRHCPGTRGERVVIGVAVAEHAADRHCTPEGEQEGDD